MNLVVRALCKRLAARRVLRDIELACSDGDLIVIVGENGSGKSTFLRVLAGIFEPDTGQVLLDGIELRGGGGLARRHVAYVPDASDPLPDLTVREFMALVAALKGAPLPNSAQYERLHVSAVVEQRLASLSFGQRKRVCLLAAQIGDPWLWLLDEPTNGIDPEGVPLIHTLLVERQQRRVSTILATNDRPFVDALVTSQSARVLRLCDGALTESPVETHGSRP